MHAAFAAMNLEDWSGLTDLCDPVSLRAFKNEIIDQATATFRVLTVSVDDMIQAESDFPGEEAEHSGSKYAGLIDPVEILKKEILAVTSVEELRELDPARVFARWLQARSLRRRLLEKDEGESWEVSVDQMQFKLTHEYDYVVLGSVPDGPDLSHVVYRGGEMKLLAELNEELNDDLKDRPEDERKLERTMWEQCYTSTASCRRQSDGSWRLIASRMLDLTATPKVVDLNRPEPEPS
jgi:hypothetical protein